MILVTGAAGHIGNVLVRELVNDGNEVRAMILPGEDVTSLQGLSVEIEEGNVLDPQSLDRAMWGVDLVFHLAGIISIMPGQDELMRRVNVDGTRNVLAAAQKAHVKRLVYTSSIHALSRDWKGKIDETVPFDPNNQAGGYDRTKAQASLAVLEAVKQGLDAVLVCPTGGGWPLRLPRFRNGRSAALLAASAAAFHDRRRLRFCGCARRGARTDIGLPIWQDRRGLHPFRRARAPDGIEANGAGCTRQTFHDHQDSLPGWRNSPPCSRPCITN